MDSRRVAYLFTLCPFVPLPRGTFQHRSHKLLGSSENKKAPRSRGRNEGHALAARQAPYHFCGALLVQTDTDERSAIVHGPVAPILPDRHRVTPLGKWGRACALPGRWLPAFTPAVCRPVAEPRAPVFPVVQLHHHAM